MSENSYLTPEELCRRYDGKIKPRTLANWRSRDGHHGPEYVKIGGRVFYPIEKVMAWERGNTFRCTSDYRAV